MNARPLRSSTASHLHLKFRPLAKEDIMSRYYYMIGHDSNEIRFEEFDGIQELADMHYDGDTRRALADDEYVFDQDEYDAWITEEI